MHITVTHRDTQTSQVFRPESSKQTKTNESFTCFCEAAVKSHLALTFKVCVCVCVLLWWSSLSSRPGKQEAALNMQYDSPPALMFSIITSFNHFLNTVVSFIFHFTITYYCLFLVLHYSLINYSSSFRISSKLQIVTPGMLYPSLSINFTGTLVSSSLFVICCAPHLSYASSMSRGTNSAS